MCWAITAAPDGKGLPVRGVSAGPAPVRQKWRREDEGKESMEYDAGLQAKCEAATEKVMRRKEALDQVKEALDKAQKAFDQELAEQMSIQKRMSGFYGYEPRLVVI